MVVVTGPARKVYTRKGWHIQNIADINQCKNEKKRGSEGKDEGCNVHGLVALDSGGGSFHLART